MSSVDAAKHSDYGLSFLSGPALRTLGKSVPFATSSSGSGCCLKHGLVNASLVMVLVAVDTQCRGHLSICELDVGGVRGVVLLGLVEHQHSVMMTLSGVMPLCSSSQSTRSVGMGS